MSGSDPVFARDRTHAAPAGASHRRRPYHEAVEELVAVVQQLSLARDLNAVMAIVRVAASALTRADGATFVLREGEQCFYADADAVIRPWEGRRFPMDACVSGWAMKNREAVVIQDVYKDARVPIENYSATSVRGLAMVPIRTLDPIGAIGVYWARRHRPTPQDVKLLQALADTTAVAIENVKVYGELEQRVRDRTAQLEILNTRLRLEIEERRRAEAEVLRLSLTDELTGLHNRRGFFLLGGQELEIARRNQTRAWLIFADLDGLKDVNDSDGHEAGDDMLREAAQLLMTTFRHADVLARMGGDEFAVLAMTASGSAEDIQARLRTRTAALNKQRPRGRALSFSVGVVACDGNESLDALLARADAAMYRHKRSRKQSRRQGGV